MNKLIIILTIISIFLLGCSSYEYRAPKDKSCDYSSEQTCTKNDCVWKQLSDVADKKPMPVTCCPKNLTIDVYAVYSDDDYCSWLIG